MNEAYEAALRALRRRRCCDESRAAIRSSRTSASPRATVAWFGFLNSLSMTLVKLTSPGVPDIYQGNEKR